MTYGPHTGGLKRRKNGSYYREDFFGPVSGAPEFCQGRDCCNPGRPAYVLDGARKNRVILCADCFEDRKARLANDGVLVRR